MNSSLSVEELAQLITRYRRKLTCQLLNRNLDPTIIEEAISIATERLMLRPELFKPERGEFNTWFYRVVFNDYFHEWKKQQNQLSFDAELVEQFSYYDQNIAKWDTSHHEYMSQKYAQIAPALIFNPEHVPDPHAETALYNTVLVNKGVVPDFDIILSTTLTPTERAERLKLTYEQAKSKRHNALLRIRKALERSNHQHQLYEWRKLVHQP